MHIPYLTKRIFACLILALAAVAFAHATPPEAKSFYPGAKTEAPYSEFRGKAYIYFVSGTKATEAKCQIVQNSAVVGTLTYVSATPTHTLTMDPADPANSDIANIVPGNFTLKFYEVAFTDADGNAQLYSDEANPYAKVTYLMPPPNGTITGKTGIADQTIKSYFLPDGDEGVRTYTFSKAVSGTNLKVNFEYGSSEIAYTTPVPFALSDDGLSLTIDLRGKLFNPSVLAPGVTFRDFEGNPIDPPSTISLVINNFMCVDGARMETVSESLDGAHSTPLYGKMHETFHFIDLTFANPAVTDVFFWSSAAPDVKLEKMTADCDKMDVIVSNLKVVDDGTVVLSYDDTVAKIASSQYQRADSVITFAIPESIKALGSARLIIGMDDVTYNVVDGVTDHCVKSLNLALRPTETTTIQEVLAQEPGTRVAIRPADGLRVTFSHPSGYMFIEDNTAGIQVYPIDNEAFLSESTKLTGKIVATYQGNGILVFDLDASDYAESYANVEIGAKFIGDISALDTNYSSRLVTIVASEACPIAYSADSDCIMIADKLPAVLNFVDNFTAPDTIANVTGIYYSDPSMPQPMLIVRSADDVNQSLDVTTKIGEIKSWAPGTEFEVEVRDLTVTFHMEEPHPICILEDKSGAVQVFSNTALLAQQGHKLSGTIKGVVWNANAIVVEPADCQLTLAPCDVTYGSEIALSEVGDKQNEYRLVTYRNTELTPFNVGEYDIFVGDVVYVCDLFEVLDDYEMPAEIESVTGFIYPMEVNALDDVAAAALSNAPAAPAAAPALSDAPAASAAKALDDDDDYEMPEYVYLVLRSPADIKAKEQPSDPDPGTDALSTIITDTPSNGACPGSCPTCNGSGSCSGSCHCSGSAAYNLSGMRLRDASSARGLIIIRRGSAATKALRH